MSLRLLVLALAAFVMGTAEFVITGLLPEVAAGLGVSIPAAGALISGYALAIVVGGPAVVLAGSRVPRKALLTGAVALFALGNLICALAPVYGMLMAGRVLAALGQAAFLGVGAVVAANLVPPQRRAQAIAVVFTGITVANVIGSPLGTLVGQHLGWRTTFWLIAAAAVVALAGIAAAVPRQPAPEATSVRGELALFTRGRVWFAVAVGMLAMGAVFAAFSYIAPLLTEVSGLPSTAITPVLVLFGLGMVAGNLLGGRFADRDRLRTLLVAMGMLVVALAALALLAPYPLPAAVALAAVGAAGFAAVPAVLSELIGQARGRSPLSAAVGGSATNLGMALGAALGGLTISAGLGYTAPAWLGAGAALLGLAVVLTAAAVSGRGGPADPDDRKARDEGAPEAERVTAA
ncbi:DHA1 family inner membrane transport protein [Nocardiopsis mwathae]|uniref:DHA1 family inner membrane transport protein n=1 Tax=Nocardiopsis mwathae TaxID=1472723 RepID=A0A7X0D901_9ACTN|nr:MFS transporter [Nocardiopsis mwathae]MBB6174544.1 DHA1 family inner membrane transport protein [Nocardiopsis mwathae]